MKNETDMNSEEDIDISAECQTDMSGDKKTLEETNASCHSEEVASFDADENEKENTASMERRKAAFIVSIAVFIVVLFIFFIYLSTYTSFFEHFKSKGETSCFVTETYFTTEETESSFVESESTAPLKNPIDFSAQQEINDEIYAWIRIPNTNVDYPILQSAVDDLYYLRRNIDKSYYIPGVIFSQSLNSLDFSDPVTLIYGHNMTEDGSMFATLHNFENEEFFENNEIFYIYIPGHILKYRIVSAYRYDNRHIMNTFDFDNEDVRAEYFEYVMNPTMIPMNVREGVTLSLDDKLVVLSTCMENNLYRYLVNGVLIEDEPTE